MTRRRRVLINAAIILLTILAFYFGLLRVSEVGGHVLSTAAR
jgi:spore maturation protein SpmA